MRRRKVRKNGGWGLNKASGLFVFVVVVVVAVVVLGEGRGGIGLDLSGPFFISAKVLAL